MSRRPATLVCARSEVGQDLLRSVLNLDDLWLALHLCVVLVLEPETLSGERGVRPSSLEIIEQCVACLALHPPLQALLDGPLDRGSSRLLLVSNYARRAVLVGQW